MNQLGFSRFQYTVHTDLTGMDPNFFLYLCRHVYRKQDIDIDIALNGDKLSERYKIRDYGL